MQTPTDLQKKEIRVWVYKQYFTPFLIFGVLFASAGIVTAPIAHRIMHHLHLQDEETINAND